MTERVVVDLLVTRNGVPVADQAQGIRDFKAACLRRPEGAEDQEDTVRRWAKGSPENGIKPCRYSAWMVAEIDRQRAAFEAHTKHVREFLEELGPYLGLEDGTVTPADFIEAAKCIRQWCTDHQDSTPPQDARR